MQPSLPNIRCPSSSLVGPKPPSQDLCVSGVGCWCVLLPCRELRSLSGASLNLSGYPDTPACVKKGEEVRGPLHSCSTEQ